jgi:hypothetical protein
MLAMRADVEVVVDTVMQRILATIWAPIYGNYALIHASFPALRLGDPVVMRMIVHIDLRGK